MPRVLERRYRQYFCSIRVELEPPTDMEREIIRTSLSVDSGRMNDDPSVQRQLMERAYFTANVSSRVVVEKLLRAAQQLSAVEHVVSCGSRLGGRGKRARDPASVTYSEDVMWEEKMDDVPGSRGVGENDFIKLVGADVGTQTLIVEVNGSGPSALRILRAACCSVSVIPSAAALRAEETLLDGGVNPLNAKEADEDDIAEKSRQQQQQEENARHIMSQRPWKRVCLSVTGTVAKHR